MRAGGDGYAVAARAGAIRFRYRLTFDDTVPVSTGAALSPSHLYAVTGALFAAPEAANPAGEAPLRLRLHVGVPPGWEVVTGWGVGDRTFTPPNRRALLGSTLAAAPDFRLYRDTAAGTRFVLAIRGERRFADTALARVIAASLREARALLGPVPVPRVTYVADVGATGSTSASLQGRATVGLLWGSGDSLGLPRIHDVFHETLHLWFGGVLQTARWWTEGVTDYYAARLQSEWSGRAGDLATLIFRSLDDYLRIPRRTRMTMDQEARANVLGDNTTLLVYRKGMLAALLLDAAIRRSTGGSASLDDVAREALALARSRADGRVAESELRALAIAAGGPAVGALWTRVVAGDTLLSREEVAAALRAVTRRRAVADPAGGASRGRRRRTRQTMRRTS